MPLIEYEISPRFHRSRWANAPVYIDETDEGIRKMSVSFTIESGVLVYDLKRPNTHRHRVFDGSVSVLYWQINEEEGPANCDQIEFSTLPPVGTEITVYYDYMRGVRGEFFGRRTPIELDESDADLVEITSSGAESLWQLAGRPELYDDPSWWWVLVDTNEGLNAIFAAMLKRIPSGVKLLAPGEGDVLLQLDAEDVF